MEWTQLASLRLHPNAADAALAADGGSAASPPLACLDPSVPTPRSEERVRCLLASSDSRASLDGATGDSETAAASIPDAGLQAAVRQLDACLPLADILPLKQGEGYLVVRRRLPAPAPSPDAAGAAAAAAGAAVGGTPAAPAWTAADEARYQRSLQQLLQLVALQEQLWPRIHQRISQAAGRILGVRNGEAVGDTNEQLLHWAVIQRLRQLQRVQRQWQRLQALKQQLAAAQEAPDQAVPPPQQGPWPATKQRAPAQAQPCQQAPEQQEQLEAAQQEPELEASFTLMQLAGGADASAPVPAPPPRPPRQPRQPPRAAAAPNRAQPAPSKPRLRPREQQWTETVVKRRCLRGLW